MARKLFRSLKLVLVVVIGVCGSDHGGPSGGRPLRVLARATPVFYATPGSSDSDRSQDYDRGD